MRCRRNYENEKFSGRMEDVSLLLKACNNTENVLWNSYQDLVRGKLIRKPIICIRGTVKPLLYGNCPISAMAVANKLLKS